MTDPDEFEQRVRAMLRERAGDLPALPPSLLDYDTPAGSGSVSSLDHARSSRRGRTSQAWLLSAAAVAVIAAGLATGVSVAHRDPHSHSSPAATDPAAPAPTTTPVGRGGPRTSVTLGLPTASDVPGFFRQIAVSKPGYRWLGWQQAQTRPPAIDVYDLSPLSAQAVVFDAGRFPRDEVGLTGKPVTMTLAGGQTKVYSAKVRELATGKPDGYERPSLVWQYGVDRWAAVQALTDKVTASDLRELAAALRPGMLTPVTLPFSLANAPNGTLDDIVDRRPSATLDLTFGEGQSVTTLSVGTDPEQSAADYRGTARKAGNLNAIVDDNRGGVVAYDGGDLYVDSGDSVSGTVDTADINRLLDGLTWSGRRGAGPAIPIQAAIGH